MKPTSVRSVSLVILALVSGCEPAENHEAAALKTAKPPEPVDQARDDAIKSVNRESRTLAYALHMSQLQRAVERNDAPQANRLMDRYLAQPGTEDLRGFEWFYWRNKLHGELWSTALAESRVATISLDSRLVAVSGTTYDDSEKEIDGELVATRKAISTLRLLQANSGETIVSEFENQPSGIKSLAFSRDGTVLAAVSFSSDSIHLWDTTSGKLIRKLKGHPEGTIKVAFLNDRA